MKILYKDKYFKSNNIADNIYFHIRGSITIQDQTHQFITVFPYNAFGVDQDGKFFNIRNNISNFLIVSSFLFLIEITKEEYLKAYYELKSGKLLKPLNESKYFKVPNAIGYIKTYGVINSGNFFYVRYNSIGNELLNEGSLISLTKFQNFPVILSKKEDLIEVTEKEWNEELKRRASIIRERYIHEKT